MPLVKSKLSPDVTGSDLELIFSFKFLIPMFLNSYGFSLSAPSKAVV